MRVPSTFARIIPQNAIDHNRKFTIREPTMGTEPGLCLYSWGGHKEKWSDPNKECNDAFEEEEPSPAGKAMISFEMEYTERCKRSCDTTYTQGGPEETKADGEFLGGIKVG